jgi:hypothetical protein
VVTVRVRHESSVCEAGIGVDGVLVAPRGLLNGYNGPLSFAHGVPSIRLGHQIDKPVSNRFQESMIRATRLFRYCAVPVTSFVLLGTRPAAVAQNVGGRTNLSACEREIRKLGPTRWGEKFRSPAKTHHVSPAYPAIPEGASGGVWIGEILIDTRGRVSGVWTIREVKSTPPIPLLNKAVTDAVAKWRFAPAAVDNVPVPTCWTVSVNVNLKAGKPGK